MCRSDLHMICAHRYADVWGRFMLISERFEAAYSEASPPRTGLLRRRL